ncbi:hypothetical protein N6H14_26650 [Paenibacillus sp. CC-CFT747]|nr:hypothetical protein N6H14_26650 [Paenibacillus sp. CC-CFT747]
MLERLKVLGQARKEQSPDARKTLALAWLSEKVFTGRQESPLYPRFTRLGQLNELSVQSVVWWSQAGMHGHAFLFRHVREEGSDLPVTIGLWEHGTRDLQHHLPAIRRICESGRQLMVLDVSGSGALMPNAINRYDLYAFFGTVHKLTADLFWLGDSLAAMRVYEVIRALEVAEQLTQKHKGDIPCYVTDRFSLYAQLAQALDPRIAGIEGQSKVDSVSSWVKARYYDDYNHIGLLIPGMLRHFDLQDI